MFSDSIEESASKSSEMLFNMEDACWQIERREKGSSKEKSSSWRLNLFSERIELPNFILLFLIL